MFPVWFRTRLSRSEQCGRHVNGRWSWTAARGAPRPGQLIVSLNTCRLTQHPAIMGPRNAAGDSVWLRRDGAKLWTANDKPCLKPGINQRYSYKENWKCIWKLPEFNFNFSPYLCFLFLSYFIVLCLPLKLQAGGVFIWTTAGPQ